MADVTLHLTDQTLRQAQQAARAEGVPVDRWIATLVEEKVQKTWPAGVLDLAGAWPDFPTAEELRQQPSDARRESL